MRTAVCPLAVATSSRLPVKTTQLETRFLTTEMHLRLMMHMFIYTYIKLQKTNRKKYSWSSLEACALIGRVRTWRRRELRSETSSHQDRGLMWVTASSWIRITFSLCLHVPMTLCYHMQQSAHNLCRIHLQEPFTNHLCVRDQMGYSDKSQVLRQEWHMVNCSDLKT